MGTCYQGVVSWEERVCVKAAFMVSMWRVSAAVKKLPDYADRYGTYLKFWVKGVFLLSGALVGKNKGCPFSVFPV